MTAAGLASIQTACPRGPAYRLGVVAGEPREPREPPQAAASRRDGPAAVLCGPRLPYTPRTQGEAPGRPEGVVVFLGGHSNAQKS